jgi:hypothetical protein
MPGLANKIDSVSYCLRVKMWTLLIALFNQSTHNYRVLELTTKLIVSWTTFGTVSTLVRLVSVDSRLSFTYRKMLSMILFTLVLHQRNSTTLWFPNKLMLKWLSELPTQVQSQDRF